MLWYNISKVPHVLLDGVINELVLMLHAFLRYVKISIIQISITADTFMEYLCDLNFYLSSFNIIFNSSRTSST